nr:MAG TPA: hypothetical protein [Caudoviricetes sp.]
MNRECEFAQRDGRFVCVVQIKWFVLLLSAR